MGMSKYQLDYNQLPLYRQTSNYTDEHSLIIQCGEIVDKQIG
jgi:hypothetical protein